MNEFDQFLKELRENLLADHVIKQHDEWVKPTPEEADAICHAARDLFIYSGWFVKEKA
jgi:hypothetical protein